MMRIGEITNYLEEIAPLSLQDSYDNAGLIVGDKNDEVNGVLVSLDVTEEVLNEAIEKGCNLIVSHHPIVFSGMKRFNGGNYIERVVMKAIKNDIALYAIHTNLDNVIKGVNGKIAEKLGLMNCRILSPKRDLLIKLAVFCPEDHVDTVSNALFAAGAGSIGNYSECSFKTSGVGTFKGGEDSTPFVGEKGKRHQEAEQRIEVIFEGYKQAAILNALFNSHPYEEVAYDLYPLKNQLNEVGSGMVGELNEALELEEFLLQLKKQFNAQGIRYTKGLNRKIKKVAFCGGSGSFLLNDAKKAGADIFVTGDFKYHQFFDAEDDIVIADIGHYESEQYTSELLIELIKEKFPTFAPYLSEVNTNPINYL